MEIRVMVVEDEPPIQRNICKKIEETDPHFRVVATADNGKDACRYLLENPVDVLFVDMNLPIMDGQQLLSFVTEQGLRAIPVVLSGYTDFAYVKSAYESNALDYLLKPLKDSELKKLLDRLREKLRRQRFEEKAQQIEDALAGGGLAAGCTGTADAQQEYCMLLLTFGNSYDALEEDEWNYQISRGLDLEEKLVKIISQERFWVVDGQNVNEKLVFIWKGCEPEISRFHQVFHEIDHAPLTLTAVYYREAVELCDILPVYRLLQRYTRTHRIFLKDAMLVYSNANLPEGSPDRKPELEQMLLQCGNAGPDQISQVFSQLLERLTLRPVTQKEAVHDVRYFIYKLCQKRPGHRDYFELEGEVQFILDHYHTKEAIQKEFDFLFRDVFGTALIESGGKAELAEQMKTYLDENFRTNITNQFLAERFGFVGSYLSNIFKSYHGVTPIEHVVQKRMDEGKRLLKKGDLKVKDIAALLGYEDSLYFSKVFKKVTGMSPREFMMSERH